MKNKLLLSVMFLLLVIGTYVPVSYSQNNSWDGNTPEPTYSLRITNPIKISSIEYRCDIYITNLSADVPFELNLLQMGFTYNTAVKGTGSFTTSWLAGSVAPAIVASGQTPTHTLSTNVAGYIKLAGHVASGGPGTGAQITTTPMKVGTLVLLKQAGNPWLNSADTSIHFNLAWSWGGSYQTKVAAYSPFDYKGYEINTPLTSYSDDIYVAGSPLPVELSAFSSAAQGRTVVLNWSTKTEKNSNRFEVERSLVLNGTWSTVGSVQASVLSNSPRSYSYSDSKLQSGKYQYRLKMIDNNGTFSYSAVEAAEVAVPKDFAVSQNYPNPFNPSTTIAYQVPVDSKVIMEVYNIAGQKVSELVNQDMSAGYYTVNFGASKLSTGVYIYRVVAVDKVSGNNFSSIKKMMLLK
jgi:hypothetical protein